MSMVKEHKNEYVEHFNIVANGCEIPKTKRFGFNNNYTRQYTRVRGVHLKNQSTESTGGTTAPMCREDVPDT